LRGLRSTPADEGDTDEDEQRAEDDDDDEGKQL
jgi:hypothetical protein